MSTVEKRLWLFAIDKGFDLITDHNNLASLFKPTAVVSDLSQTTLRKVLYWVVCLGAYIYTCVHILG